ncbi:hypothetical protein PCE1_001940 [Barthelona sp. PCE]
MPLDFVGQFVQILFKGLEFKVNVLLYICVAILFITLIKTSLLEQPVDEDESMEHFIEDERIISEFSPNPLCSMLSSSPSVIVVEGKPGPVLNTCDGTFINFATRNYRNFEEEFSILEDSIDTLAEYGVGTCGPRGFFGTLKPHLDLEETTSKLFNEEAYCIHFPLAYSARMSVLSVFAHKRDIVFVDELICAGLLTGIALTKAKRVIFRHNDADDFERVVRLHPRAKNGRSFVILEGIYEKTGCVANLPEFVHIAKEYNVIVVVDDALALAVLGKKGLGSLDYHSLSLSDVDLLLGSYENAVGSMGGFCISSDAEVIEHQRLTALGYVFSATIPTFHCMASVSVLKRLDGSKRLGERARLVHRMLFDMLKKHGIECNLLSDPISPRKVVTLSSPVVVAGCIVFFRERRIAIEIIHDTKCESSKIYAVAFNVQERHSIGHIASLVEVLDDYCSQISL